MIKYHVMGICKAPYGLRNPVRHYRPTSLKFLWPLVHWGHALGQT